MSVGELDPRRLARLRRVSLIGAVLTVGLGAAVLLGWIFDVPVLESVRPGFVAMKANTAVLFTLLGTALVLNLHDGHTGTRRLLASIVVVVAAATLSQYLFGIRLGIDELLLLDRTPGPSPGRMSPVTAVTFILLGFGLMLPARGRALCLGQIAALLGVAGALIALCGYLYGVGSLYALGPYSAMAVHTAAGVFVACVAFVLARPDQGLMARVSADTIAGQALRRVLPVLVLAPMLIGWLSLEGQKRGLYQAPFGLALVVLANVLLLSGFSWWLAGSLERSERSLRQALGQISELNTSLERRVEERTLDVTRAKDRLYAIISLAADAIISTDEQARITIYNRGAEAIFGWSEAEVLGRPLEILLPGAAPSTRQVAERRRVTGLRKNGEAFAAEAALSQLELDTGLAFTVIVRDIAERVRKEDERKVLVALLENASDFIGIADPDGKPIYVNPAGRKMVELPDEVAIERTQIPDYYAEAQRAFATDVILKTMLERGRWSGETYFRNWRTNEAIPVSDEHFVIREPETGRVLGMGTVTRDIAEARRVSDRLRESEERFRLVIDEAPIGMALVDLDGRFLRVNRALCEIVDRSAEELMRSSFHDITHPDDLAADVALAEQLARGEIPRYHLEKRYLRKDGSVVPILLHGAVLRDGGGRPVCYIAQVEDISERKQAEESLRIIQESLSLSVDASGQGLWDWNLVTDRAQLSPRYWALIGRAPEDRPTDLAFFKSLIHPDDWPVVQRTMEAHLQGRTPESVFEFRLRKPSGEQVWLRGAGRVTSRDEHGTPLRMSGVISDVTEQKHAEEERAAALREKETLLKEIHHRVKNNLQMLSSLFYLQRQRTEQPSLRTLLDESRDRILSIALIHEKLYQSEHLAEVDFGEYLSDLTSRVSGAIGAHEARAAIRVHAAGVHLDIERAIPCALLVNELVSNALKHAFPDERAGTIDIEAGWIGPGLLRLSVQDSGIGFPEGLDWRSTRTLGMQLVVSLTAQLRGTARLIRDHGTRFEIEFPFASQAAVSAGPAPPA